MAPRTVAARHREPREVPVIKGQGDLLTEWRESGKITDSHFATLTRDYLYASKKGS